MTSIDPNHPYPSMRATRPLELVVALYALCTGLLFLLDPHVLDAPVYDQWQDRGRVGWGVTMLLVAFLHAAAMWVNGAYPRYSIPTRLLALGFHFSTSVEFAIMFYISGAIWGSVTFGILLPGLLLIIGRRMLYVWYYGVQPHDA